MRKRLIFSIGIFVSAFVLNTFFLDGERNIASAAGPEFLERGIAREDVNSFSSNINTSTEEEKRYVANRRNVPAPGGLYPIPQLERAKLTVGKKNSARPVYLKEMPKFETQFNGKVAGIDANNDFIFYTLDKKLQEFTTDLVKRAGAPHLAVVAMDPVTGKILAISEKSSHIKDVSLHSGFPAASLFKVVTSAAAIEANAVQPDSMIRFRGGTYTLNQWNYNPDKKKDKRALSVSDALGMSCNPVFARIALQHLSPGILKRYSEKFGFNTDLGFEADLDRSSAFIPHSDYELSRTAAGFGEVRISPIHAAAMMSGIANDGIMPRPYIVNQIISKDGEIQYQSYPQTVKRIVSQSTASTLMKMMQATTTVGTSRNEFYSKKKPLLPVAVAAKTGTLSGNNPKGLNHWFIAAAPINNPKIAVAVIAVNPTKSNAKASRLGRQVIQKYLDL